nr:topoisomerase DNA-binding C4 zinc finger domain-containing protein [Methanothrix sp.]
MTQTLEKDMAQISERKIKEDEVIEESRVMLTSVFDELSCNQEGIGQSLKDGLRTDKIVGTCEKCGSELIIRRGHRGSRFIGCSGYPNCRFTLPLPRSGAIVVTDRLCEEHGMFHIRIINKGKRPWDLGCPHCNFLEWQARKALELAEGKESGEAKPQPAKKTARKAGGATGAKKTASKSSSARGDGLASLPGVGPKTLEKLEAAGVRTSQDLLSSKAKALAEKTGLSEKKIAVWMKAAKARPGA